MLIKIYVNEFWIMLMNYTHKIFYHDAATGWHHPRWNKVNKTRASLHILY